MPAATVRRGRRREREQMADKAGRWDALIMSFPREGVVQSDQIVALSFQNRVRRPLRISCPDGILSRIPLTTIFDGVALRDNPGRRSSLELSNSRCLTKKPDLGTSPIITLPDFAFLVFLVLFGAGFGGGGCSSNTLVRRSGGERVERETDGGAARSDAAIALATRAAARVMRPRDGDGGAIEPRFFRRGDDAVTGFFACAVVERPATVRCAFEARTGDGTIVATRPWLPS